VTKGEKWVAVMQISRNLDEMKLEARQLQADQLSRSSKWSGVPRRKHGENPEHILTKMMGHVVK